MKSLLTMTLTILLLLVCLAAAGEEVVVDGVLHVRNTDTPTEGVVTLALQEQWRAGGEDDEDVLFGLVTDVLIDDDGTAYLLDQQMNDVKVYTQGGEFLRTLSREGEGPGEVRTPSGLVIMPDGTLGITQAFPGKIVQITLDDTPVGEVKPGEADGLIVLTGIDSFGDHLVLSGLEIDMVEGGQDRHNFIRNYSPDGVASEEYHLVTNHLDFANLAVTEAAQFFPHLSISAVGPKGRVFAPVERNEYVINVYAPDGSLERVIERDYKSWDRTDEENALMERAADVARNTQGAEVTMSKTEPDVTRMHVDEKGELWVLTSRGQRERPDGVVAIWDVFDVDGHFVRQMALAGDGDGREDGFFFGDGARVIKVAGFLGAAIAAQGLGDGEEAEVMNVVCYTF